MQDTNWKTWVVIAAVLVGVLFEFFKRMPEGRTTAWDVENLRINNASEPFSIRRLLISRFKKQKSEPAKVAALNQVKREQLEAFLKTNTPTTQTTFDHLNKAAETKAEKNKKKKDEDEWEEFVDPKTGKKYRRKKKKKAKKDDEKKEVLEAKKPEPQPKHDHDLDTTMDEALLTGSVTAPPEMPREEEAFDSLEEWARRLLSRPDVNETKRFIMKYHDRLVSAEVFYKVAEMMTEDSRPEMKRLGVMCAGLTPSVMSFQLLAHVTQGERSDSKVRQEAERFLTWYTDMSHISVLENILRSPTPSYSTIVAAQKLEAAARRHLSRESRPSERPPTQSNLNANVTYFRRFLVILQNLANSQDSSVKDQAGRTLSSLQALLTPSNSTRPPAPPTQTS